jgi:hypothetical protein
MTRTLPVIDLVMRGISYFLGGAVLILAVAAVVTQKNPADLAALAGRIFGPGFIVAYSLLLLAGLVCWRKQVRNPGHPLWSRAALQAANGIATLALTFTLLGISLGIGGLAEQRLSPETIHDIIAALTAQFSMAFMTTVVGLPTSAALRALVVLTDSQRRDDGRVGDPL